MLTLRRNGPREDVSIVSAGTRPVLLATFDVPFAEDATEFAVDSAVESGQPLMVVNVAQIHPRTGASLATATSRTRSYSASSASPLPSLNPSPFGLSACASAARTRSLRSSSSWRSVTRDSSCSARIARGSGRGPTPVRRRRSASE